LRPAGLPDHRQRQMVRAPARPAARRRDGDRRAGREAHQPHSRSAGRSGRRRKTLRGAGVTRFDDASLTRLRAIVGDRPAIAIEAPQYRRACVLIALVRTNGGWSILFSRRSPNLAAHSGQIAFPGGAVEEGEALDAAAIREAEEEVGIPAGHVELIGRLDDLITNSGFLVA